MSGPKLSAAEIERRRQEQLERERQEALRRLREAQKAYRTACGKIEDVKRYSLSLLQQVDAMYRADAQKEVDSILASLMTVKSLMIRIRRHIFLQPMSYRKILRLLSRFWINVSRSILRTAKQTKSSQTQTRHISHFTLISP